MIEDPIDDTDYKRFVEAISAAVRSIRPATLPAPVIHVDVPPAPERKKSTWEFEIVRNKHDQIVKMIAKEK